MPRLVSDSSSSAESGSNSSKSLFSRGKRVLRKIPEKNLPGPLQFLFARIIVSGVADKSLRFFCTTLFFGKGQLLTSCEIRFGKLLIGSGQSSAGRTHSRK
jgi:hypothetical protein